VWLLAVGLVLVLTGTAAAGLAAAIVARHRAQAAADLGALAGAVHAAEGEGVACAAAADVASANDAQLVSCRLDGLDLVITARVEVGGTGAALDASATARAGPARAGPARA